MTHHLSDAQVEGYRENGYLFPLDIFDRAGVERILGELEVARRDAETAGLGSQLPQLMRTNAHFLLPFVNRVARDDALLDPVESILGPDLLLWSAEFFIKPAQTDKIVSWHQDLTYWGLGETDEEMTAWVALSEVSPESGCMRFVPGSHRQPILPHQDTYAETNLLSRGQQVAVDVDENAAVDVVLKPGQVSFHHGRIFHASGPNRSNHDRVGLVFRFITPAVKQLVAERDYAMIVRGSDPGNHWVHVEPPTRNFAHADLALREQVLRDQQAALAEGATQPMHAGS